MGFYLRKAFSFGPVRFNLSKSGIGASVGVKGLRVGSGPRGAYVHGGRGGLYYRKSLSGTARGSSQGSRAVAGPPTIEAHRWIDSAEASSLTPEDRREFVQEVAQAASRSRLPVWFATLAVVAGACLLPSVVLKAGVPPGVAVPGAWGLAIVGLGVLWWRDQQARTTVVVYDLEDEAATAWRAAWEALTGLGRVGGLWVVEGLSDPADRRRHGDAEVPAHRVRSRVTRRSPTWLRTNTSLLQWTAGRQTLLITPDALWVVDPDGSLGSVPWSEVSIEVSRERVREVDRVPTDAVVVGHTWRHARKDGGRDQRYRDNPQVPIVLYGVLHLRSARGLDERFHVSAPAAAERAADALTTLASAISPPPT